MQKLASNAGPHVSGIPVNSRQDLSTPAKPELIQKHLEKVLSSAEMRRSKKLCQFLRFTVNEVLQGHGSELKEYAIAVGVFRRGREFDPGADPIVRVQARRLRAKLERYYQSEGRHDPFRIDYPVGSYSPKFTPQTPPRNAGFDPSGTTVKEIAILPFLSAGPQDCESFNQGLLEDLAHGLSGSGIRVISRVSCSEFKGLSVDIRKIAERLGVGAVISGSVRLEGARLRVVAQLVDANSGVNIWSGVYDQELNGILATQEKVSREIVEAVQSQLRGVVPRAVSAASG